MTSIKNWSFIASCGPYQAPELAGLRLSGEVYGHPSDRFPDGKGINTSTVRDIITKDKQVVCASRTYQLEGPPDAQWVDWLRRNHLYDNYKDLLE